MRSDTLLKSFPEVPCKCGYVLESVWHVVFDCCLISHRRIMEPEDILFTEEDASEVRRILQEYEIM